MGLFSKKPKTPQPEEDNSTDKATLFGKKAQAGGLSPNPYAAKGPSPPGNNPYAGAGAGAGNYGGSYGAGGGGYGGGGGGYGGGGGGYGAGGGGGGGAGGYGGSGGGYGGSGGGYGGATGGGGGYGGATSGGYGGSGASGYGSATSGGYNGSGGYGGAMNRTNAEPKGFGGAPEPKSYGSGPGRPAGPQRNESDTTLDTNRTELFGGKQRQQQFQQRQFQQPPPDTAGGYPQPGGYGVDDQGYGSSGGYGGATGIDRNKMSEQEEGEAELGDIGREICYVNQQALASTRNALRAAEAAEMTGRDTLTRLGEQGERLANTEKNLDLARTHGNVAAEKARELKTLNRSMFAVHIANPFNSAAKNQQREDDIIDKHQQDRIIREQTRKNAFDQRQRIGGALDGSGPLAPQQRQKMSLAEKANGGLFDDETNRKIQDDEDQLEGEIELLGDAAARLKKLAIATSKEVDHQNEQLTRLTRKTDKVDDQIALNTANLRKFGA